MSEIEGERAAINDQPSDSTSSSVQAAIAEMQKVARENAAAKKKRRFSLKFGR